MLFSGILYIRNLNSWEVFVVGLSSIGVPGLIIILVIALIVFGPSKLPQIGRAAGDTIREFKNSTQELRDDVSPTKKSDDNKSTSDK